MMSGLAMIGRDLIVIGASAGGLRALVRIAQLLPGTLSACVLVVLHISRASRGMLASVISRRCRLPVKQAEQGDPIRSGQIYVAPADYHMSVGPRGIELDQGPRVNRTRPAIDPLFRSAAAFYGNRVAGVVLTGFLQDGTLGLAAIKRAGGIAIVQDPTEAEFSQMPQSALAGSPVDYCARLSEIPALLADLALGANLGETHSSGQVPGVGSEASACRGPAWTASAVLRAQDRRVDDSLSIAIRALDERAELLALMADNERVAHSEHEARELGARALKSRQDAARLRAIASSAPKFPA